MPLATRATAAEERENTSGAAPGLWFRSVGSNGGPRSTIAEPISTWRGQGGAGALATDASGQGRRLQLTAITKIEHTGSVSAPAGQQDAPPAACEKLSWLQLWLGLKLLQAGPATYVHCLSCLSVAAGAWRPLFRTYAKPPPCCRPLSPHSVLWCKHTGTAGNQERPVHRSSTGGGGSAGLRVAPERCLLKCRVLSLKRGWQWHLILRP